MLEYGGAARQYFGQVASNVLRFAALAHQVHEIGVPIEVVIILQQGEFIDLLEIRIGLVPRQPTGQVDRHLFVSNSVRNNAFIAGDQPIDGLLLLLFYAPDQTQGRSEQRRVGQEGVSTCISRWAPDHLKTNENQK